MSYKYKTYISLVSAVLMLSGLSSQLYAESGHRQVQSVSYSYDHWPKRWSSAIHQQQDSRFPNRQKSNIPAQQKEKSISEHDLFYLPSTDRRYGFSYPRNQANERLSGHRYLRDVRMTSRESAYAYRRMQPMYFSGHFGPVYGGFGMNAGTVGLDPVIGMPGNGIPFMSSTPYGYPAPGFQRGGYWTTPHYGW